MVQQLYQQHIHTNEAILEEDEKTIEDKQKILQAVKTSAISMQQELVTLM